MIAIFFILLAVILATVTAAVMSADFSDYLENNMRTSEDESIDVVLSWCDMTEERWLESYYKAADEWDIETAPPKDRYKSTDEIMYNISLLRSLPWVRKIFVVTPFGYFPYDELKKAANVTVIDQNDLLVDSVIPTFKSNTIEANIWRIPGLSENFIYSCDDMFIHGPVTGFEALDYFFEGNNLVAEYCVKDHYRSISKHSEWYRYDVGNTLSLVNEAYGSDYQNIAPSHFSVILNKTVARETFDQFQEQLTESMKYPFRSISRENTIHFIFLTQLVMVERGISVLRKTDLKRNKKDVFKFTDNVEDCPPLFCINTVWEREEERYHTFMKSVRQHNNSRFVKYVERHIPQSRYRLDYYVYTKGISKVKASFYGSVEGQHDILSFLGSLPAQQNFDIEFYIPRTLDWVEAMSRDDKTLPHVSNITGEAIKRRTVDRWMDEVKSQEDRYGFNEWKSLMMTYKNIGYTVHTNQSHSQMVQAGFVTPSDAENPTLKLILASKYG